jgi:hypothetical protein
MASKTTIIPRDIKGFNNYIVRTCAYLVLGAPITNAVRFNWTASNLSAWQAFLAQWNQLYAQYINKKSGYTTDTRNSRLGIIASAILYAETNKLIELVKATVSLNQTDCSMFNLPAKLAVTPSSLHPIPKTKAPDKTVITEELVYPEIIPIGGGILHIKAYLEKKQSGRPHKPGGFDLLEYAVAVFYLGTTGLPATPGDTRLSIEHSSKSNFKLTTTTYTSNLTTLAAGAIAPSKIAILFFRWAKSKHPTLDGPWSVGFSSPIL